MPRADAAFGFRPIKSLNGGEIRVGYYVLSSASVRVFKGDVLDEIRTSGLLTRRLVSSVLNVVGVAAKNSGVLSGQLTEFPVYDDPSIVYRVQANQSTAISQAEFMASYRIVATAGSTTLDNSLEEVDITTAAISASHICKAIRLSPEEGNDLSQFAAIEVILEGDPTEVSRA